MDGILKINKMKYLVLISAILFMAKLKAQIIEMPLYKGTVPNSIAVPNKESTTTGADWVTRVAKKRGLKWQKNLTNGVLLHLF